MLFDKNDTILFTGDSVTDCGRMRPVGEGELFESLGTGYVRAIDTVLQAFAPELQLRIVNTGIGGNKVTDLEKRWQTDVMDLKPDWLCVLIGVNDSYSQFHSPFVPSWHTDIKTYSRTLESLVEQAKPRTKGMILMSPFIVDINAEDPARCKVLEYANAMKDIAKKHNTHFIDLQGVLDEYCKYRHPSFLTLDRIHPNFIGSMLIAKAFLKEAGLEMNIKY